jgi:hypothetical protein
MSPRFVSDRDFRFFQHINREVISDIIDVKVVLYKIVVDTVAINIYGESTEKTRYKGITLDAVIKYAKQSPSGEEGFGFDATQQDIEFRFARKFLQDVDVYPETGDIVGYNENFYEIHNINEAQLIASRPEFNHSIICEAHLTRRSGLNIVETHI